MNQETKIIKRALRLIDVEDWQHDDTGTLNLYVPDSNGRIVHAWMTLRPAYCDRGHVQLNIDGIISIDGADCFPRYFFSFEEADKHARTFLKWRLWKHRTHDHGWGPNVKVNSQKQASV